MSVALMALLPSARPAAALTWQPALDVAARYDDNVLRTSTFRRQVVTVMSPAMALVHPDGATTWLLSSRGRFEAYSRTSKLYLRTDRSDVQFTHAGSERDFIVLAGRATHAYDPLDLERSGALAAGRLSRSTADATISLWRLRAMGRWGEWGYETPGLRDGRAWSAEAAVIPLQVPTTSVSIGARNTELALDGKTVLRIPAAFVGVRRLHTPSITSEVQLGAARRDDLGRPGQRVEPAGQLVLTATPLLASGLTSLSVRVTREIFTTGQLELATTIGRQHVSTAWGIALDAEGGVFSDPSLERRASLEIRDTLPGSFVAAGAYSFGRTRSVRLEDDLRADTRRASVSLARPLFGPIDVNLGYQYIRQNTLTLASRRDYRRNRITMSVSVMPR